jgi:hypothetical protein
MTLAATTTTTTTTTLLLAAPLLYHLLSLSHPLSLLQELGRKTASLQVVLRLFSLTESTKRNTLNKRPKYPFRPPQFPYTEHCKAPEV